MTAKLIMLTGALLFALGAIIYFFPRAFSWFGRLPGDIRVENSNTQVYMPLVSMLLVSALLTLLLNLWRYFGKQ